MNDAVDVQLVEVTSVDSESSQMEYIAKLAAQLLNNHYPNHIWAIGWAPGLTLVVKHLLGDAKYGYTVDCARCATVSELERYIVAAGGELLERLGFPRGAWNGDMPTHTYDGVRKQDEIKLNFGF